MWNSFTYNNSIWRYILHFLIYFLYLYVIRYRRLVGFSVVSRKILWHFPLKRVVRAFWEVGLLNPPSIGSWAKPPDPRVVRYSGDWQFTHRLLCIHDECSVHQIPLGDLIISLFLISHFVSIINIKLNKYISYITIRVKS